MSDDHAPSRRRLLPSNDQPCVWMSAGVLRYRLCDREFECDVCPLHHAIRGDTPPPREEVESDTHGWEYPNDRFYWSQHIWHQVCGRRRVRVGLDQFAARVLGRVLEVSVQALGTALRVMEPAARLRLPFGFIDVRSPLPCVLQQGNQALVRRPQLLTEAPYDEGWMFLASADEEDLEAFAPQAFSASRAKHWASLDMEKIRTTIGNQLEGLGARDGGEPCKPEGVRAGCEQQPQDSKFMADGGTPSDDVLVGSECYRRLLSELIG